MTTTLRRPLPVFPRFDELLGRPVSDAVAGDGTGLRRPDGSTPSAAIPRQHVARPHLLGRLSRAIRVMVYRSCRPIYIGLCCWPGGRCRLASVAHTARHGHVVHDHHLQPVPLHHLLPQQPRPPRDRARGARDRPCGRELSLDAVFGAGAASAAHPLLAGMAALAPAVRGAAVYGASRLSKLLDPDWFGGTVQLAAHRARECATWTRAPGWAISILTNRDFNTVAAKSSSPPSCSSPSACGAAAPATRPSGSPSSSSIGRPGLGGGRGLLRSSASPCSSSGWCLDARPRSVRRSGPPRARGGAPAGLAPPLPRGAR